MKKIAWIDGSLGGQNGNTCAATRGLLSALRERAEVDQIFLADKPSRDRLEKTLGEADGFVFTTGTYWDSWGSPMQSFFEDSTDFEASDLWLGKPAAVVVTMHSVGGKSVLSRLQGVLSTLGVAIPPMSGMVYSLVNELALRAATGESAEFRSDFWQLEDLRVIAHNLLTAIDGGSDWKTWPVDTADPRRRWFKDL